MDGEASDVAAGEESWIDDERVGTHNQVVAVDADHRPVLHCAGAGRRPERGHDDIAEQLSRKLAARAVTE